MSGKKVMVTQKNHLLMMELNRPEKRNAFDLEMYRELSMAYGELNRNPELRCGLLFARGDHFTAGLDLPEWAPCFTKGKFPDLMPIMQSEDFKEGIQSFLERRDADFKGN